MKSITNIKVSMSTEQDVARWNFISAYYRKRYGALTYSQIASLSIMNDIRRIRDEEEKEAQNK